MEYVLINLDKNDCDCTIEEFATEKEAIDHADYIFNNMSDWDKKRKQSFYIIKSADPNEDSERHLDGDVVKEYI